MLSARRPAPHRDETACAGAAAVTGAAGWPSSAPRPPAVAAYAVAPSRHWAARGPLANAAPPTTTGVPVPLHRLDLAADPRQRRGGPTR